MQGPARVLEGASPLDVRARTGKACGSTRAKPRAIPEARCRDAPGRLLARPHGCGGGRPSVGPSGRGRDLGESRPVHLSGGLPDRHATAAHPPCRSPSGLDPARGAQRAEEVTACISRLRPPPPTRTSASTMVRVPTNAPIPPTRHRSTPRMPTGCLLTDGSPTERFRADRARTTARLTADHHTPTLSCSPGTARAPRQTSGGRNPRARPPGCPIPHRPVSSRRGRPTTPRPLSSRPGRATTPRPVPSRPGRPTAPRPDSSSRRRPTARRPASFSRPEQSVARQRTPPGAAPRRRSRRPRPASRACRPSTRR